MIRSTLVLGLLDAWDERRARRLRAKLGRDRWLVSWSTYAFRGRPRGWLARISCEHVEETVERHASSRCAAIERARVALLVHLGECRRATSDLPERSREPR